jgi:cell division protein FtsW
MATSKNKHESDQILLLTTLLLLAIGLVMVFSASFVVAAEEMGDPYYFLKRQAIWTVIGLIGLYIFARIHYLILKRLSLLILIINFMMLALVYSPLGTSLGTEAQRWLAFGPIVLQPAEFSKLAFVLFTAAYMSSRSLNIRHTWTATILPLVIAFAAFMLIQLQPDMGTAIVVLSGSFLVVYCAGVPVIRAASLSLLTMVPVVWITMQEEYRMKRIFTFIDPWAEPSGSGYQIIQSLYALGPGHIFGSGLGHSRQKLFYLPEPHNDFIFAVIGEELGFIGAVAIILLYLVLIWRGVQIAVKAPDLFSSLLAAGLIFVFGFQVLINIAVVTASMPVTGINLPLISAGGSSVFFSLISIGILLNISKHTRESASSNRGAAL